MDSYLGLHMVSATHGCHEWTCGGKDGQEAGGVLAVVGLTSATHASVSTRKDNRDAASTKLGEEAAGLVGIWKQVRELLTILAWSTYKPRVRSVRLHRMTW